MSVVRTLKVTHIEKNNITPMVIYIALVVLTIFLFGCAAMKDATDSCNKQWNERYGGR